MPVELHIFRRITVYIAVIAALVFLAPHVNAYYTNIPASIVVGQTDFAGSGFGSTSSATLRFPAHAIVIQAKLVVSDGLNNRILIFNKIPTTNNASADVVIGQPDFSHTAANQGGTARANTLNNPRGMATDGTRLFVTDATNQRVLIFNTLPASNNAPADVVIGQPDMITTTAGTTASKLATPVGVDYDQQTGKLAINEFGSRIIIFNHVPTTNGASADVVVGQADFSHRTANQGGVANANTVNSPRGARFIDGKLFVADALNNRVLIWNSIPTANNQRADVVIGQPNFTQTSANQGGATTSATLNNPNSVMVDDTHRIYISDISNNRILIFKTIPKTNNQTADIVVGQPDFFHGDTNQLQLPAANTLNAVRDIFFYGHQMIVADTSNNRVLIFSDELANISLSRTITGQPDGLLRFSGTVSTSVPNQHVVRVEYSVNGSTWTGAFPTDGKFDSAQEDYYFDFDPTINEMADQQGYTIKIRSTHDNDIDTSKAALYFQPFLTNAPTNNSFTLNRLPSFTFTIQKQRFADLKENLDHFRVMVKTDGSDWQPYIDNIPIDYNSVRLAPDNLRPNQVDTMNGTYEDKFKIVSYDQDNSVITVQAKAVDNQGNTSDKYWGNGGQLLNNATYQWKVQAEDHEGQFEDTDPQTLRIGTRQVVTSRPYFLLSIYAISGIPGYMDISTNHPDDTPKTLTMTTDNLRFAPTFAGHAFAGSTVTFAITDDALATSSACLAVPPDLYCTQTYQTTVKPDSSFRYTIPKAFRPGNSYDVTVSVKDTGDNYNELPTFTVQVAGK